MFKKVGVVLCCALLVCFFVYEFSSSTFLQNSQTSTISTSTNTQLSSTSTHATTTSSTTQVEQIDESKYTVNLLQTMHMTFDDEFTNPLSRYVDSNGNITCNANGKGTWQTVYHFCSRTIPSNDEAEVYIDQTFLDYLKNKSKQSITTTSPFSQSNGVLAIEAQPIDPVISAAVGPWAKYTSGLITTQFSFSQTYGYFEMRAKLPSGQGLWPAFWLLPVNKNWPPEIDAMEAFGGANSKGEGKNTMIHYATHAVNKSESCGKWYDVGVDITKDFHTYGVLWEQNQITYYFDGKPYATCPSNKESNQPFYMLVNLAVGSSKAWPGSPTSSNRWPAYMYVDYVRAYQHN